MAEHSGSRSVVARAVAALALVALVALGWTSTASADASQGTITGRVTDGAGHAVGPDSGMCALLGSSSSSWSNLAADGTYRIENVDPGSYAVRFVACGVSAHPTVHYAEEFYPNLHDPAAARSATLPNVQVSAGQTVTGIDAQLEVGGQLTVKLVDASSTPRSGICVTAQPRRVSYDGPWNVGVLNSSASGVTGSDGRVALASLPPDDYVVIARACDYSVPTDPDLTRIQYSGGVFEATGATTTHVGLSEQVSTQMTMSPGASISGKVTLGGTADVGGCVEWGNRRSSPELTTTTDAQGNYSLVGITPTLPGSIRACGTASDRADGVVSTWAPSAASRWTAEEITLAPGAHRSQDLQLRHGTTLSMIITAVPSPSGCQAVVTDPTWQVHRLPLRATTQNGVYAADAFDLPGQPLSATLECGGRRVGVWRVADANTPFFESGWTENSTSPVVQITYDATGPTITASPNPATMNWSSTPVTVSFTCTDGGVGVFSCPGPVRLGAGEATTVSAMDADGNVSTLWVMPRVDSTAPTITVTGSGRSFKGDEPMQFACDVADDRSGVAWVAEPCPAWGTPASALGVGTHTFHLKASDWAGNIAETIATVIVK